MWDDKGARNGFLADGILSGFFWLCWPLYFKFVLGKFSLMGIFTSLGAFFEIFSAKYVGKLTDKYSAQKVLRIGVWMKFVQIGILVSFMWFPSLTWIGVGMVLATVMWPLFDVPFYTRLCERAEEDKSKLFEFFVVREVILGFVRSMVLLGAAGAVYEFGEKALGFIMIVVAFAIFGFRKF